MPTQTRAITLAAKDAPWKLESITLDDPLEDEVLVKYVASGICHSDISARSGVIPVAYPTILGHEGAGKVVAVGSKVTRLAVGDSVLTSFTSCNQCPACKKDQPYGCKDWGMTNFSGLRADGNNTAAVNESGDRLIMNFLGQSSFSEHALVREQACVKVPAATDLKMCASLGCGIQTGYGAVSNIIKSGPETDGVLVVGLGAVGMSAVIAAVNGGVKNVIGCDLVASRRELAQSIGAHVVDANAADFKEQILKLTGGQGPEHVVECTGVPSVIQWAYDILRSTGVHLQVGAPPPETLPPFTIQGIMTTAKTFIGGLEGFSDLKTFIPFLAKQFSEGKLPLDKMSKEYKIDDFEEAFAATINGSVIKPVLVF